MVNDQLIRLHHLKQLRYLENMSQRAGKEPVSPESLFITYDDVEQQQKADQNSMLTLNELQKPDPMSDQQAQQRHSHSIKDGSPEIMALQQESKKDPLSSKKQDTDRSSNSAHASPIRDKVNLKKQTSGSSGNSSSGGSSKRRLTWRNLLSPSYKSRSDEFHKLFCDKISKNERLIADYACALHREILIQGRVYISVNYVAFYSNLFSWVTKLVVRLRDISEIYKANTARIIPNAIQIIMTNADKHVFASFVARDKSYVMMLRIWQNNLMSERMTDQEIRNLVHFSYGKDLGMSDNEELKINSPDPATPANVPELDTVKPGTVDTRQREQSIVSDNDKQDDDEVDRNNNSESSQQLIDSDQMFTLPKKDVEVNSSALKQETGACHTRYNSFDLNAKAERVDPNNVIAEVVSKLSELSGSYKKQKSAKQGNELNVSSADSSAVILDTPPELIRRLQSVDERDTFTDTQDACYRENLADGIVQNRHSFGASSTETKLPVNKSDNEYDDDDVTATRRVDEEELIEMTTHCDCKEHQGHFIVDQEFDISVDTLFTLMFTNSKFMRTYMIKRGMTDTIISGWKRSNNNGDKSSNSSTMSHGGQEGCETQLVRIKQVRQLNYSMNIKHIWAKQVRIEERQNICQVKPGVYVLESQSINSGIPYGETFTVDMTYCLTRSGDINKSRMLVHSFVNFNKEKQNWKLAMVKSMIERQCIQGVNEFVEELITCTKEYIDKTLKRPKKNEDGSEQRLTAEIEERSSSTDRLMNKFHHSTKHSRKNSASHGSGNLGSRYQYRHGSLVRAKSKLKERKLKSMYRYYIDNDDLEGGATGSLGLRIGNNNEFPSDVEFSDSESSLPSFSDFDDNGSMIMMTQVDDLNPTDRDSADRSFSDVDGGGNLEAKRKCSSEKGNWRTSLLAKLCAHRNRNSVEQGCANKRGGHKSSRGQHSYAINVRNFCLGTIGVKNLAGFTIITLMLMVFAMIASHVIILRRLDTIEAKFRVKCDGLALIENKSLPNNL